MQPVPTVHYACLHLDMTLIRQGMISIVTVAGKPHHSQSRHVKRQLRYLVSACQSPDYRKMLALPHGVCMRLCSVCDGTRLYVDTCAL